MGAKSAPTPPSLEPSDMSSYESTTGVCCWCEDFWEEIDVDASKTYSRRYNNGALDRRTFLRRYKLTVALESDYIKVEVRYKFEGHPPATPENLTYTIGQLIEGVHSWNNQIAIAIEDPECGTRVLPVVFEPVQVSSGEHYKVLLYEKITFKPFREHVLGYEVRVQITTNAWVFSHEHAHCFGVPDEYPYSEPEDAVVERLVYIRPDGGDDPPIDLNIPVDAGRDRNIMSAGSDQRRMRHGYGIAIEVQKLLKDRLKRDIRCWVDQPRV